VSIGKRFINMARSELNSLLDRAGRGGGEGGSEPDSDEDLYRRFSLDQLTDAQLEAEIERRQKARATAAKSRATNAASAGSPQPNPKKSPPASASARTGDPVAAAYAALEVPPGSNFETVRRAYRQMMRKYHPDHHTRSPDKQKAANELTQKLTESYKLLEKRLRRP
jgi:DnaJ-domain-containing protein 1